MSRQELIKFLERNRVKKDIQETFYSHVSLIDPKGRFQLNTRDFEEFWDIYNSFIVKGKHSPDNSIGLAERPQTFIPILVDIDIKFPYYDDYEDGQKLISDKHINLVVKIYQEVIKEIVKNANEELLLCFVLEKPSYQSKDYIKNGFHLHFPNLFLQKEDHEAYLIPRIKKLLDERKVFADIGFESSSLLDKGYTRTPWLLYGSKKDANAKSYKLTKIYDYEMCEIDIQDALELITIYDSSENEIVFTKEAKWYLPQILSIIPYGRKCAEIKNSLKNAISVEEIKTPKHKNENKIYKDVTTAEELRKATILTEMLSIHRTEDRNEWLTVGWTLYNIGRGCDEALDIWIRFSSRCRQKFDEDVCRTEWTKMSMRNMSIATLIYMAKQDNPKVYGEYVQKELEERIQNSIDNESCTDHDIAKTLFFKYGAEFKCISISQNLWFQYRNHRWVYSDCGVGLSKKISDDSSGTILYTLIIKYKELTDKVLKAANDGERAMYSVRIKKVKKFIDNLKSSTFKRHVMRECMEVFLDEDFAKKINKNPYLICFKNGVYDLKQNIFRDGLPEDYISLQMNVEYKNFNHNDAKIREVHEFIDKIFPDKSIRQYFMDVSCNIFVGGNRQKHIYFWSGEGHNGKSVTESLFEKMLGEYAIKLPTSLIVGKRTQSSAACPELVRAGNGVRWAVLQEPDKKDVINIGILKELTGNDTFFARGLYKEGTEIEPMFKLIVVCNDPPIIPQNDKAAWNRIRVIPFESTFCFDAPESLEQQLLEKRFPRDPNFEDKIPEMIQALAWILIEHRKLGNKVSEPDKVRLATDSYQKKNDIYRQFIDENLVESKEGKLSLMEIYRAFKEWHRESLPGNSIPVKNDLKEYFIKHWGEPTLSASTWIGYKINTGEPGKDRDEEKDEGCRPEL